MSRLTEQERQLGKDLLRRARDAGVTVELRHNWLTGCDTIAPRDASPALDEALRSHARAVYEAMEEEPNERPTWGIGGGDHDARYAFGGRLTIEDPGPLGSDDVLRLERVKATFLHRTVYDRRPLPSDNIAAVQRWIARY